MESDRLLGEKQYGQQQKRGTCTTCCENILNVVWFCFLVIFIIWNVYIFRENWNSIRSPSPGTGVTYEEPPPAGLKFPAITACNIGKGAPLLIFACKTPTGKDCHVQARNFTHNDQACFTFNHCEKGKPCNPFTTTPASENGEEKERAMFKLVMSVQTSEYPKDLETSGVRITLHDNEEAPKLNSKGFFAPPGLSTLVRMRKLVERSLDGKEEHNFEATSSYGGLRNYAGYGRQEDVVHLHFTYRMLSVMVIQETPAYTILTFFSEMGGLAGLLLGLGAYQVFEFWFNLVNRKCCGAEEQI